MSVIDQALKANELYAKTYDPKWGAGPPKPKLAVVTCMDPRLSDLPGILGLKHADIDVIRTGGPAVTEDVLAELLVSTRVLGSKEIMLLNHTGCGFTTFTDAELNAKFSKLTGDATPAPMRFFAFKDPEQQTKDQIEMVRSHPWISKEVPGGLLWAYKSGDAVLGTGTGWPDVIVAVIMAILALQGAVLVIRQAVNELRLPMIATA